MGWYLAISALVLSIAAAALWLSSSREPWGRSIAAGFYGGAQWPGQPQAGSTVDLDRLARLKQMVDSGHLTQEEFQQVKARILGPPVIAGAMPPSAATSPAEELQRLKSLHDSGVLTDSEYDELRKRAVARL